ncbi:fatty acid desaturase [Streptomyces physcomitrii]|uniref:Stearoyl-CoA 9-desaturase n=1 Tax=Streptomyces physcomitrii TaxID=2724184 RepID=A0ABX1GVM1_9ACTN|nr:fatty acid desaturase [Streptomyces physcomitrii]NKI40119.1 stearoyl-CoA 9-desaturase [Streptomyces physcomitrii]
MAVHSAHEARTPELNAPRDTDVRESLRVLPGFLQMPLTLMTGKALAGQRALPMSPGFHLGAAWTSMLAGLAISTTGYALGAWYLLLLLPGWAMTLHGMRNLRMMIFHQCSHRNMYARRGLDTAIGYSVSSLLVIQNFARYSKEHVSDHHAVHHMTLRDPTVQAFLISLDLHPGMTRGQMWRRVLGKMSSPRFHLAFAIARVRSFAQKSAPAEKATALVLYGGTALAASLLGLWPALLLVWFVPLVPLYQMSNTLRLCVKHTFPAPDTTVRRGKEYFAGLTNAIFLGERAPDPALPLPRRALAWLRWSARMACLHFPSRYLVLTGDTVVHDYHHRYPASRQWHNYLFVRQQDLESGHRGWPAYTAEWGLVAAVNRVFDSLSIADPEEFDVHQITSVSKRELFAAFDD